MRLYFSIKSVNHMTVLIMRTANDNMNFVFANNLYILFWAILSSLGAT